MRLRLLVPILLCVVARPAFAQPTCELPISAFLTDATGAPLDGALNLELRFYSDAAPDAPAVECRSFEAVDVTAGWIRLSVDACSEPILGDCGAIPLHELFVEALGLWVGVSVDGAELGPRLPVGAVPFAVHAADARTLQGHGADEFEAAGALAAHAADPDPHHSSTSEDVDITPRSVTLGDTSVVPGRVDFGPDANDELTASIVTVLTGGGEADALHTHAGHGVTGGCYTGYGTTTCADGWTAIYPGYVLESLTYELDTDGSSDDSASVGVAGYCVDEAGVDSFGGATPMARTLLSIGDDQIASITGGLRCVLCCR